MAEKSSDRMETDTNKSDIEKLRPIVKMEYAKILTASNSRKEMEIKAILEENSRKLDSLRPNAFKINNLAPMKFFDEKISGKSPLPIASTSKCSVKILTTNQTEHVPIRILPEIKPLPVMFSWVSVQQNYAVEDEKVLPNIPYMGDNVEDVFVEDLRDHYEHGIHGIAKSAFLNDEMFFDLVQNVAKQINAVDDGDVLENPPDHVFAAISNVFPDKGTVGDLKSKFRDLLEKHKGISLTSADQCNPNIDGPGAVSASAEQTMHSFSHLFCRRCYKYDCYMHPTHTSVTNVKRKPPDLNLSEYICEHCYLTLPECSSDDVKDSSNLDDVETKPSIADDVQRPKPKRIGVGRPKKIQPSDDDASVKSESSSVKPKPPKRRELDLNFDPGEWTPAEESIYRGFALAFGDNYCAIGACMLNKTCKQVYAFAMKDRINNVPRKSDDANDQNSVKTKKFRHKDWHKNYTKVASLKETDGETSLKVVSSYIPCVHDANNVNCNEQPCCCIERSTFCEKFCNCSSDCPNRFPGCRCRARCDTKQCPCHLAVRECDPDLCPNCGACDFTSEEVRCQNVNIQRGLKQHLLLAPSDVAGWGCFIKNAVEKNAFISEYCGEIISQDEAERRGKVYDRLNCSFLFNLNEDLVVDATRKGNKIRFANHSVNPNCVAKVMMVNGDHRIGIFAKTAIAAGEELFFDYRYGPKEQLRFVGKERDRAN